MNTGAVRAEGRPSRAGGGALRVLLSEGGSTSAREAVTALGLAGHHVEVMDPARLALARFSRFVRRFHRCPPMGSDPEGFRDFVLRLVAGGGFDVLLPIHEQGLLLARIAGRLAPHVAVALPAFESYARAVSGIGFLRLLDELGIARPPTRVVTAAGELQAGRAVRGFPVVLKAEIGTASRGVWIVPDAGALARAAGEIERAGLLADGVLVQDFVAGPVEHAQGVFADGRLVAAHGYRGLVRGAGGGPALKESVARPAVRGHLARIGSALASHGALSVDYVLRDGGGGAGGTPVYIDCNPRLVEPMSALAAGVDLVGALLRVSLGRIPGGGIPGGGISGGEISGGDVSGGALQLGREGVRTRLALQALMGLALGGAGRAALLREGWRAAVGRGAWAGSREELMPVRLDPLSLVPLLGAAAALAVSPRLAGRLTAGGWGAHLLTPAAIRRIGEWPQL